MYQQVFTHSENCFLHIMCSDRIIKIFCRIFCEGDIFYYSQFPIAMNKNPALTWNKKKNIRLKFVLLSLITYINALHFTLSFVYISLQNNFPGFIASRDFHNLCKLEEILKKNYSV